MHTNGHLDVTGVLTGLRAERDRVLARASKLEEAIETLESLEPRPPVVAAPPAPEVIVRPAAPESLTGLISLPTVRCLSPEEGALLRATVKAQERWLVDPARAPMRARLAVWELELAKRGLGGGR